MHADHSSRLPERSLRAGLPLAFVALLALGSCGRGDPQPPTRSPDASAKATGPVARPGLWEGPTPPIPTQASPRFVPLPTLVTQRIDKATAPRRIGDLALDAFREISQIPNVEIRATQLARLCLTVGPNVEPDVVDQLAQAAFDATGQVTQLLRLQDAYDDLAQCLAHAGAVKRASLLAALFARAAQAKEPSVFTWPFRSAGAALAQLTPAEVEPLLGLAERLLPQTQESFHKEQLLSGMAAAGIALPPARALALFARAEAGVAGAAFADSRAVFLGELAQSWVGLARRQPALLDRAAQGILRLEAAPFDRAAALGKLVELPTFPGSPQALVVLRLIASEVPKLPAAEKAFLLQKLIAQAAKIDGATDLLGSLVAAADPERAYRAHIAAVRGLSGRNPAQAIRYADAAVALLDKMEPGTQRNWRHTYLFRALGGVDPQARKPFLSRLEKRAAGLADKSFRAWTLLELLELARAKSPEEALRLQAELMRAVDNIGSDADRLRILEPIYALGLPSGPAAAHTVMGRAITMTGTGVSGRIWWRFIQSVSKQPKDEQRRWLPRLLPILVDHSPTWRPEELASRARLVARLAPQVMPLPRAEALILQVWRAVERAPRRSAEVETQHVVSALRAIGVGLAAMGSTHFPILVRRLESRIPRRKTWSEPLMSHVTSLGCLLSPADGAGMRKRLETWVARGTEETRLIRRGAIVAGLVACHGSLDAAAVRDWLSKGPAELSWDPMVQFLIRLPLADLQAKAALLPERRQRIRMYHALIGATIERGTRELSRWRLRRDRSRPPSAPR